MVQQVSELGRVTKLHCHVFLPVTDAIVGVAVLLQPVSSCWLGVEGEENGRIVCAGIVRDVVDQGSLVRLIVLEFLHVSQREGAAHFAFHVISGSSGVFLKGQLERVPFRVGLNATAGGEDLLSDGNPQDIHLDASLVQELVLYRHGTLRSGS